MFDLSKEQIEDLYKSDLKMKIVKFIIESNEYSLSEWRPDLDIHNGFVGNTHVELTFKHPDGNSLQILTKNLLK